MLKEEEEKKKLQLEFEERKKRLQAILVEKSALLIQRYFRGMKGRRRGLIVMATRRQLRAQRIADERKRTALGYIIREFFGYAKELPSDTIMEKVIHRFPSWWKNLIIDCVDGDWEVALNMLEDQVSLHMLELCKYCVLFC